MVGDGDVVGGAAGDVCVACLEVISLFGVEQMNDPVGRDEVVPDEANGAIDRPLSSVLTTMTLTPLHYNMTIKCCLKHREIWDRPQERVSK